MLFIKATNFVLEQIDAHLRERLKLERSTLAEIEKALLAPLMSTPLDLSDFASEGSPEDAFTEGKEPPSVVYSSSSSLANQELKFGITWGKFLELSTPLFAQRMQDNLKNNPVESNKLLILFRLRNHIEKAKNQANAELLEKDNVKSKTNKSSEAAESIDETLLKKIVKSIDESNFLVDKARSLSETTITENLSYKCGIGDTETLLIRMNVYLQEYAKFCSAVDKRTKREPSHLHAFRDMLPHVLKSKDFIVQCHLKMNDYILYNINVYSQHIANQKRGGTLFYLTSFFPGYDPKIASQKREQVIDFFISLKEKLAVLHSDNKGSNNINKAELEEAVLLCIDIHLGHCQSLAPSGSRTSQRIEEFYSTLHRDLLSQVSSETDHASKCLASKILKSPSVT